MKRPGLRLPRLHWYAWESERCATLFSNTIEILSEHVAYLYVYVLVCTEILDREWNVDFECHMPASFCFFQWFKTTPRRLRILSVCYGYRYVCVCVYAYFDETKHTRIESNKYVEMLRSKRTLAWNIICGVFVLLHFLLCMMKVISQYWEKEMLSICACYSDVQSIFVLTVHSFVYIDCSYIHVYIRTYPHATVHSAWANIKQARNNCSICAAHFMISLSSCDSQIKIIGLRRNYARAQQQICSHMCERVHGCACVSVSVRACR